MSGHYLSGIFGTSPVGPLEGHIIKVHECVADLLPFMDAVLAGNLEERDRCLKHIVDTEREADEMKREIRRHLPTTLFMPVARRDLLEVLRMQDTLAGAARDIAGLIVGRNIVVPEALGLPFRQLVETSVAASEQAVKVINELDELVESAFGSRFVELVDTMLWQLDALEHETDLQLIQLYRALQAMEDEMKPVDVMFLYRLFDLTGKIGDRAQRVGSRLMLMLAK